MAFGVAPRFDHGVSAAFVLGPLLGRHELAAGFDVGEQRRKALQFGQVQMILVRLRCHALAILAPFGQPGSPHAIRPPDTLTAPASGCSEQPTHSCAARPRVFGFAGGLDFFARVDGETPAPLRARDPPVVRALTV